MTENTVTIKTGNEEFSLTRRQVNAVRQYLLEEEACVYISLQCLGEYTGINPTEEDYKDMARDFILMRDPREADSDLLDRIFKAYYELDD